MILGVCSDLAIMQVVIGIRALSYEVNCVSIALRIGGLT